VAIYTLRSFGIYLVKGVLPGVIGWLMTLHAQAVVLNIGFKFQAMRIMTVATLNPFLKHFTLQE
jgi:hypothetical protein